jgi:hypothetical protein|tara:strand:- start:66 stop:224 length:159 start_codon:yes stop_codon:yes gene_type:complete
MEIMRVYVYSGEERKMKVRGSNMKDLYKHIRKLFADGHTNIIVSGGIIGTWR